MTRVSRIAALASILIVTLSSPALAASAGQSCKSVGTTSTSSVKGKKTSLVCTKVGKSLKWKAVAAALPSAPVSVAPKITDEVSASDATLHSISVSGSSKRTYILHVPPTYSTATTVPLMIALHGRTYTASRFRELSQLDQVADSKNFIIAYPDGEGTMWNAGNCCSTIGTDDVTLISGMIDSITSKYNIDKTRVWVLGWSNGAMMAYRAACEISEKVTAIAVGAGTFAANSCKPTKAVSVIQIHGTADQTLSIDGTMWGPSPLVSAAKYAGYAGCFAASSSTWTCPNGSQIQVKIESGSAHYAQTWWAEMTDYLYAHPRS